MKKKNRSNYILAEKNKLLLSKLNNATNTTNTTDTSDIITNKRNKNRAKSSPI